MEIFALIVGLVALVAAGFNWIRTSEQLKVNDAVSTRLDILSSKVARFENIEAARVYGGTVGGGN